MAGGKFSEALLFGLTVRESANDGSDFTNPAADYRRLFLGEDGLLHLRDSAGTVTDIGSGSGIAATIVDAKGDLIIASAADTVGRFAAGANDTILMYDSGQSLGVKAVGSQTPSTQAYSDAAAEGTADTYARGDHKHAMPANGGLIAVVQYRPGSQQVLSTSSTTYVDADATNLIIPFTVPASGNVIVRLTAAGNISVGGGAASWNLRDGSGDVTATEGLVTTNELDIVISRAIYKSGLTPGASLSWKWGIKSGNAGHTARLVVDDGTPYPPATMEVWAAP